MRSGQRGENRSRLRVALTGEFVIAPATAAKSDAFQGQLRDLSCCGLGGLVEVYLPAGTAVRVKLSLSEQRTLEVRGLVSRCESKEGGYEIGVRFIDPPLDLRVTVSSLTAPALRGPLPPHLQELVQQTRELRLTA